MHGLLKGTHVLHRGYPSHRGYLDGFIKARALDRKSLLAERTHVSDKKSCILVTTFHPTFNDLGKIVRRNWDPANPEPETDHCTA